MPKFPKARKSIDHMSLFIRSAFFLTTTVSSASAVIDRSGDRSLLRVTVSFGRKRPSEFSSVLMRKTGVCMSPVETTTASPITGAVPPTTTQNDSWKIT